MRAASRSGVVLRARAAIRAALGRPVEVGRPDGWSVLRATLVTRCRDRGRATPGGLDEVLDRGRMADLADLAALVVQAEEGRPWQTSHLVQEAVAARDDRANDVAFR